MTVWLDVDERVDHYLGLPRANIVAAETLLTTRDNLADVVNARAMMCVLGDAGLSNTLSVNASLLTLAPEDVYRVRFQARPTPRDNRHVLFDALGIEAVARPNTPIRMTWAGGRGPAPTLRGPGRQRRAGAPSVSLLTCAYRPRRLSGDPGRCFQR